MNRKSPGLKLSKAIPGFLNYKSAEGLSPRTIYSYRRDLDLWLTYQDDVDIRPGLFVAVLEIHQAVVNDNGVYGDHGDQAHQNKKENLH